MTETDGNGGREVEGVEDAMKTPDSIEVRGLRQRTRSDSHSTTNGRKGIGIVAIHRPQTDKRAGRARMKNNAQPLHGR